MIMQQLTSLTIQGIGIDAVEIVRFSRWHTYSDTKLSRIFSSKEIAYCKSCLAKSAERFAARFAVREALYKALCQAYPHKKWVFLSLCKKVSVSKGLQGQPELMINGELLASQFTQKPHIFLSITHTSTLAMAWVMVQSL